MSPEPIYREWQLNYTMGHNSTNVTRHVYNRTFRFKAQSMKGEGNPFDIFQYRKYDDVNLIIVMAEVLERSEDIWSDGLAAYIDTILFNFKWLGIIVAGGLTIYFITFSLALVKL